jgi:cell division septum initiation protein DivIVA
VKYLSEKKRHVDRMEKSFTRMVIMAETQADELREEAKKESKIILNESKLRAEELLKEARRRHDAASLEATEIIEDAKKRREDINGQYDEVKKELVAIYEFIEKAVLGENSQIKTIFAEKAKQAIVNE